MTLRLYPTGILFVLILLLAGCQGTSPDTTPTPQITATAQITATSTPEPLGSPANPIIIAFSADSAANPRVNVSREEIAALLSEQTGLSIQVSVLADDRQILEGLRDQTVHLAWLQPLTYIYAREQEIAEVGLLTNHFGTYYYGTKFLANVESGFLSYFDTSRNISSTDAANALRQLDGRRPCWVDPGSISGYILPLGILEENQIEVQPAVITQTHTAVIRSLYIKGICDFGAAFAISGDPRTASTVIEDLTDAVDRIMVIWQSEPVIPNLNLSYTMDFPAQYSREINTRLVELAASTDGKRLLTQALDNYDIQDLRIVDDSVYDPLRVAVDQAGADVSQWIGR